MQEQRKHTATSPLNPFPTSNKLRLRDFPEPKVVSVHLKPPLDFFCSTAGTLPLQEQGWLEDIEDDMLGARDPSRSWGIIQRRATEATLKPGQKTRAMVAKKMQLLRQGTRISWELSAPADT